MGEKEEDTFLDMMDASVMILRIIARNSIIGIINEALKFLWVSDNLERERHT